MTTNEIITEKLEPYFVALKNTKFEITDETMHHNRHTTKIYYTFNLIIKSSDESIFGIIDSLLDLFSCGVSDVTVNNSQIIIKNCELN